MFLGQGVKKPSIIYSDDEAGWAKGAVPTYLEEQGIKQYITRNHAQFAERFIRTYKGMLYKRIDSINAEKDERGVKDPQWDSYNFQILLTHNNFLVHSATTMTPQNAAKASNAIDVKTNLELKASHNRKYPALAVGEKVLIRRKKIPGEKERTSN